MVSPVGKTPPTPPPGPATQTPEAPKKDAGAEAAKGAREAVHESQQQAQQEQVQQTAQEGTKEAHEAQALSHTDLAQQFLKAKEKLEAQMGEFVQVFESIVQEGVEGYRTPQINPEGGAYTQDHGRGFTPKEQQVVREFLRQLEHLVGEQGLEFSHALHYLKAQQGGNLWQQLSQILQKGMKGMPGGMEGMTPEQMAAKLKAAGKLPGTLSEGEGPLKELPRGPGAALAEMIRAETNPKIHAEAMLAALAILKQDGMERSHRELTQYLRHRWGLSEREMQRFLRRYPVVYFQGPMPREEGHRNLNTPWYPLIALAVIPLAKWMGLDWGLSIFAGTLLAAMMFLVGYLTKEKE